MKRLFRRALLTVGILVGLAAPAAAQTACANIIDRAILTAAQWNACFTAKSDLPLNLSTGGNTTGTLPAARMPAFGGGDVSFAAGGGTGTIAANVVSNAKAAQAAANTMKGNWTGSTANEADNAMPSCPDTGANHLNYVSSTGVICGTSVAAFSAVLGTVTAASTTNLATSGSTLQTVTGNTAINGFGTGANLYRIVRFTGTPLLNVSSTLVTPTNANIQACPGDVATLASDNSGTPVWTILSYSPFGLPQANSVTAFGVTTSATTVTSVTLPTCGKWTLEATAQENGSGASNLFLTAAISANNNSYTGTVNGKSKVFAANYTGGGGTTPVGSAHIGPLDVTVTSSTPYYLVTNAQTNSDNFDAYIRAVRSY